MTATIIDDEVDTIIFDEVELNLPCEAEEGCDRPAEWKVRVKCCNNLWLLCQRCVDIVIQQITKHKDRTVKCAKCETLLKYRNFVGSIERI